MLKKVGGDRGKVGRQKEGGDGEKGLTNSLTHSPERRLRVDAGYG